MWHFATDGRGAKDMVVLPYRDRLLLFSRYLQQLVMESLGKETDREGKTVHQGIAVYGNKGSTDQHAYVQQLREGVANFFVTFIQVLQDRAGTSMEVEPGVTCGDYLSGFLQGTRRALYENGRESITITVERLDARTVGVLIALYERAVGLYASLVNINAYHQPGVEAGKKAAGAVLKLQGEVLACLRKENGRALTAAEIAAAIGAPDEVEAVFHILNHAASNPDHGVTLVEEEDYCGSRFRA
jgi:glucose-6-phosphate isomerase